MTTSRLETEAYFQLNNSLYNDHINKIIDPILPQFERMMKSYVMFNMVFLSLGTIEFLLMVTFFTFLAQSAVLALSLALVFLTFFSYFILKVYYQTKKPEQYHEIIHRYLLACKGLFNYQESSPEHHIALANACCKLADNLHGKEYMFYRLPKWLESLHSYLEMFSCWWHWQDVFRIRELLLITSVEENIKLVKCEPTSLEVDASLANAYVMFPACTLIRANWKAMMMNVGVRWKGIHCRWRKNWCGGQRAIEEFKVLNDYAPNDPWVHAQLAYSYRDLQMPKEEIKEYETILKLNPGDRDTLYKLGLLYFQQGLNAQGLRIYEELKRTNYKKAESLMENYRSFKLFS